MLKKILHQINMYARLVRLPNLLMLAAGQYFVRHGLIEPVLELRGYALHTGHADFLLLVLSTLLIAAGGYIINDYFDIRIDAVNRPGKGILFRHVRLRTAIWIYYSLTAAGCLLGVYVSLKAGYFMLAFIHIASAVALWFYSRKYKRMAFAGNITVAVLAALSLLMVWLFEFFMLRQNIPVFAGMLRHLSILNTFVFGFAAYAFLTTLLREMVKDIEDVEGDRSFRCRTAPITYGISFVRRLIVILAIGTLGFTTAAVYRLFAWNFNMLAWYFILIIGGLLLYFLLRLAKAKQKKDYHYLSMILKILIIAGILSMQLFRVSM